DVVIGAEGREAAALHELCAATPGFTLRVRVSNMAELMSQALLCIGGGGITTLERLFLRVPTIAVGSTEHEDEALQALGDDGYLNLIATVDTFVFLDDVQFERQSWQMRNRILLAGKEALLSVPTQRAPLATRIGSIRLADDGRWRQRHATTLQQAYSKAPFG